jgi:hypothetical protein
MAVQRGQRGRSGPRREHLSQALDEVSPDQQQEINKKDCATEQLISDNLVKCVCGKNEVKMANSD